MQKNEYINPSQKENHESYNQNEINRDTLHKGQRTSKPQKKSGKIAKNESTRKHICVSPKNYVKPALKKRN
jgi:hypothetical protein